MPLIVSLRNAPKRRSIEIMKLIKSDRTKKFDEVYEFVILNGGLEYSINKVKEYSSAAKNSIKDFKESDVKNSMMEFVDFVSEREY